MELTDKEISEYLHRCYTSADGLWFIKVEEKYGFDSALDVDIKVWKIMPKIQSRFLKTKLGLDRGLDALLECLSVKLKLDGFEFKIEKSDKRIKITIDSCPWHNIMANSNRAALSEKIGSSICNTEYSVWAKEFREHIKFKLGDQICKGSSSCVFIFENED